MIRKAVSCLLLLSCVSSLSSSASPGDNFDLSNWKITLPDSSATEKSPSQLEAGYEDKYFYTASDGSMAFYVKGGGGTTDTAKYSRSELRQLCDPDNSGNPDRYNWFVSSGNYIVSGKYKIGDIDSSSRKIVIQQIHAYDGPPLIKMKWEKGKVYALVKTDASGDNEESYLMGDAPQYEQFLLKTQVKDGYLKLYLNNNRIYNINVKSYWSGYGNYFKAGNYLQSTSTSSYATVYIYYLSLTHDGSCSYTSDSFIVDQDENGSNNTMTTTTVAITIICVIIGLLLCAIGGYCFYKKKYLPAKGNASFENDGDKKQSEEQQQEEQDADTLNQTQTPSSGGAYDMDEIEIDVTINNQA